MEIPASLGLLACASYAPFMVRIVGVHGVANYLPDLDAAAAADQLARTWTDALRRSVGAATVDVAVAYYADLLRGPASQGLPSAHWSRGVEESIGPWAAALGATPQVAQGLATAPLRQFVHWIATRFGLDNRLVHWFVRAFLTEVHHYLRDPEAPERRASRQRVAETIARHRPTVVIAHSFGSVVVFETLCHRPDLTVDLLLTVGSPLGMPDIIFDRLHTGTQTFLRRPPGVRRWIDIADVGDIVAVPRQLGGHFDVDVHHQTLDGLFDFHRAKKYLASPLVGAAVVAAASAADTRASP